MAELNFTSLKDTIIPPSYIEEVSLGYPSIDELKLDNLPGTLFVNEYGVQETSILQQEEELVGQEPDKVVNVSTKVFLMLNEKTYNNLAEDVNLNVYVIVANTNRQINLLRNGDFTFKELQSLLSNRKYEYKVLNLKQMLENVEQITNNNITYYKPTKEVNIQVKQVRPNNMAVFTFAAVQTVNNNSRVSLASENTLYGKINGQLILRDDVVVNENYYFLDSEDLIWAGGTHQHEEVESGNRVYMEGLKHTTQEHGILHPQLSQVVKVYDKRVVDIDNLFASLEPNFNFIEETRLLQDNKTAEKLAFIPKSTGVSPVISSIVKREQRNLLGKTPKNTSNLLFIDPETLLRKNSLFSAFYDRLDNNEQTYVHRTTYLESIEVDRVSVLNNENVSNTVISTTFKAGSQTSKVYNQNIPGSKLTSDDKVTSHIYFEEAGQNTFGNPLTQYKVLCFVDEVPQVLRKSEFYYTFRMQFVDGIREFISSKITNLQNSFYRFKAIYSTLSKPTLRNSNGMFAKEAKTKKLDISNFIDELASMVAGLQFFYNLSDLVVPDQLLRSLYFSANIETGNFYELEKIYNAYEGLVNKLIKDYSFLNELAESRSIEPISGGKEKSKIEIQINSDVLNLNFENAVGLKFVDSYDPNYSVEGSDFKTPVFLPAVSRRKFSSTDRLDASLSSPQADETFLTYHKPYTVFLDKDYRVRKQDMETIEDNQDYTKFLSILLDDSVRKTKQQKYTSRLGYSTTKKQESKKVLLGQKDTQYHRYVGILESLADSGISVDQDLEAISSRAYNSVGNRAEVQNLEQKSKLMNLDTISTKLDLSLSKIIQNSVVNREAVLSVTESPGKNPLAFAVLRERLANKDIPFQYGSFSSPVSDTVLFDENENLKLLDNNNLAYYYYNYSTLGEAKVLVRLEDESLQPVYENITADLLDSQNRGSDTKYLCKVEMYSNDEFLTNLYDIPSRVLENNFVIIQGRDQGRQAPLSSLINISIVTAPELPEQPNTLNQTVIELKAVDQSEFNNFEKYFASSIYITQPSGSIDSSYLRTTFNRADVELEAAGRTQENINQNTNQNINLGY